MECSALTGEVIPQPVEASCSAVLPVRSLIGLTATRTESPAFTLGTGTHMLSSTLGESSHDSSQYAKKDMVRKRKIESRNGRRRRR